MKRAKLTRQQFAEKAGVSCHLINKLIIGARRLTWDTAKKLEEATAGKLSAVAMMRLSEMPPVEGKVV